MSQAPDGDIYLVVQDDTIIHGVFTVFKNAGKMARELTDKYPKSSFRIRPYRIFENLIKPLKILTKTKNDIE